MNSYRLILLTAQCFALLPISGTRNSLNELDFKLKFFHTFYSLLVTVISLILLIFELIHSSEHLDGICWYFLVMKIYGVFILTINIASAPKWPKLMKQWSQTDTIMDKHYGYMKNFNLRMRICIGVYFITVVAGLLNSLLIDFEDIFKFGFYSFVFEYIPRNYFIAVIFMFVYFIHHFLTNFNDFFIISTSMGVALRFQQIRKRLEKNEGQLQSCDWFHLRLDYDRLSHLSKELDDAISYLILASFAHNMYFVISYLFYHLMMESEEKKIFFYVFFPVVVLRFFAVCLYTSWVNDESLGLVNILNSVSSRDYNSEIGRWLVQMGFDNVGFTGGKIFKVTRSIFLSVVSIVVTYELVVMQFHSFSTKI